jgi:urease subunit alpha
MKLNDALPAIKVDPKTYRVTADGGDMICKPADHLPLARLYNLF